MFGVFILQMRADSWFRGKKKLAENEKAAIGVLAFEFASLMSKVLSLWRSISDDRIIKLRDEISNSEGMRKLVSDEHDYLLGLAITEILENLGFVARSVSHLGKRCSNPVLRRLDALFIDLEKNPAATDHYGLEFNWKKMGRKVKKMERFITGSMDLYQEMEVLAELEQRLQRMQANDNDQNRPNPADLPNLHQKVVWQRQEVKRIQENSLWNRSYDYTVRLLGRSLFTIFGRIRYVFGINHPKITSDSGILNIFPHSPLISVFLQSSVHPSESDAPTFASGPLRRPTGTKSIPVYTASGQLKSKTRWSATGCMTGSSGNEFPDLQGCMAISIGYSSSNCTVSGSLKEPANVKSFPRVRSINSRLSFFSSKCKLLSNPPPLTLGAAALALQYANAIIVIEKFAMCPHLIAPDVRDELYDMLPASIRAALRTRLKSHSKNVNSATYDAGLAAKWTAELGHILEWLAPLAHNMIRWQSERTFEQQHIVSRTNMLLLQTLYFANQAKTEAAITELLVGVNYLYRFHEQLHQKPILKVAGSTDFGDYLDANG